METSLYRWVFFVVLEVSAIFIMLLKYIHRGPCGPLMPATR